MLVDFPALFAVLFAVLFLDSALDFLAVAFLDSALFAESGVFVVFFAFFAESRADSLLDSALLISFGSKYKIRPQCGQVTITSLLINSK